ncbi:uncharacterized protein ACRADG_008028 isoform 3-T3 [Cochliomyia hominivorax]
MSNSVVTLSSFNILFITQVLTVLTSTIKYNEYVTDKGENISIPCIADGNIMWVKENGSNNSTIIQTGKYLVLTNVSASDRGLYVCFAAVTSSSKSWDYDGDQNDNNSSSLDLNDKNEIEQNDDDDEDDEDDDEIKNKQVLLTSTTTTTTNTQKHVNDSKTKTTTTTTFIKPLIENNKNIKSQTETQNASTTSMLPMPNVTITATIATTTPKSTILNDTASASATKTTTTTTTIIIKSLSTNKTTTTTILGHDHPNGINNTYLSLSSSNSNSNRSSSSSNSNTISSSSSSDKNLITLTPLSPNTSSSIDDIEEQEFQAFQKINLTVRTPPGPVTKLYFKASTILGFLVWRFNKTNSGGYPVRSFTAEFRNVSYVKPPFNSSFEHKWSRMDPINIAPNVRQMEVYRLEPNTTYEFRIWANNQLGSGEVVTTNVTTLPETKEEEFEDGWDSIELIPNIILNPGFCETDGQTPAPRTVIFGGDDDSDDSCESESDHEPRMEKFKRKLSVFFTDPTIYRSHI